MSRLEMSRSKSFGLAVLPIAIACVGAATACSATSGSGPERSSESAEALGGDGGTITISGTVADAQFVQVGIVITLSGSAQATVVTGFDGAYSFTVPAGGSYTLNAAGDPNFFLPPFSTCLDVEPSVVHLNNQTTSTVVDFTGTGTNAVTNCAPAEVSGATSGTFTLSGVVSSGGAPVPGVKVTLNGSAQGFRITDETGAYSFAVNRGSYSLTPSGTCASDAPSVVNVNNLTKNTVQNFTATSCPPAPLALCPTFDALFGLHEPAACNTVSTEPCAGDRLFSWAGAIWQDFFNNTNVNDCRFGAWEVPPDVNDFTIVGFEEQSNALALFTLQLFGCAEQANLVGPLSLSGTLIPPDLIQQNFTFTTADLAALDDEFIQSINDTLVANGSPVLTAAQTTALRGQLSSAATRVPGVVSSSSLTYSTCGADGGTD